MMGTSKRIGRIGAMTVAIGAAAVVVMSTVVPVPTVSPAVMLSATETKPDSTALILGFTSLPTPDDAYIDAVENQYIEPTHPGRTIEPVAVTTPEEGWPLTGLIRLGCAAVGAPRLCGPGGAAWPDEPWWKLSGLFDLTYNQSNRAGLADLETAMAEHPNDHLVIYGYSQGATIANLEKQRLADRYPAGTKAPDIDFVLGGDTAVITRQYDGVADFPLYPLNLVADLNAVLGFFYVHLNGFDVSLPADPTNSPVHQGRHGDTDYYFFETKDLPLFGPLRTLGVPEPVIDVADPFIREIVELGYDRSIKPWEPTPARLIPPLNPVRVADDLVDAIGEGIDNAAALVGSPAAPAPVSPAPSITDADISATVAVSEAVAQPNSSTSTPSSASEPSDEPKARPSATPMTPKKPKPAGGPAARKPTGQQTQDAAAPRKHRSTTAGSNGDGAPRAGSTSSTKTDAKPAGSSASDDSAGSSTDS